MLPTELDIVVECARAAWENLYGAPRVHSMTKTHGNTGKKRGTKSLVSLASFAKQRKLSIASACAHELDGHELMTLSTMQTSAAMSSADVWRDQFTKEVDFNNAKYLKERLKSLREGSLLPGEIYFGDADLELASRTHRIALRDARLRAAARKRLALRKGMQPLDSSMSIFVHSTGAVPLSISVDDKCRQLGCSTVGNALDADIVVVSDLTILPDIVCWDLTFSGGRLCTAKEFVDGRARGAEFKAAVSVGGTVRQPRAIWLSSRFQREHVDKCASLRRAMSLPQSVWGEMGRDDWSSRAAVCIGRRGRLGAVAVIAESESSSADAIFFTPCKLVQQFISMSSPCSA